jgi:hypothetical protein
VFPLPIITYVKIGLVAFSLLFTGFIGYRLGHAPYVELKAQEAALAAKRTAENEARAREDELKVKGLKNELETKSLLLKRYYADRMHNQPGSSTVLSGQGTASGADATPSYDVLIGQCAETTLKYTLLQQYEQERLQSFTKEN